MFIDSKGNVDFSRILKTAGAVVLGFFLLIMLFSVFEQVDANEILVVQSPTGDLTAHTTPGIKWQGWGKVTFYQKRSQFSFSAKSDQGDKKDQSLPVMFNDGGSAHLSGVMSWEMPLTEKPIIKLHTLYGSQQGIEQQLVRPSIERAIYLTGPLMSSAEAYSARKPDLLRYFEDQARNGVYQMETVERK